MISILENRIVTIDNEIDSLNKLKFDLLNKLDNKLKIISQEIVPEEIVPEEIIPQEIISQEIISEETTIEGFSVDLPSEIQKKIDILEKQIRELELAKNNIYSDIHNQKNEKSEIEKTIKLDEEKIKEVNEKIDTIQKNNFIPKILLILIILYLIKNMLDK